MTNEKNSEITNSQAWALVVAVVLCTPFGWVGLAILATFIKSFFRGLC